MPFQAFQQGSESRLPPPPDSRTGRFRVFPTTTSSSSSQPYPHSSFSNFSHPHRPSHQHHRQHSHNSSLPRSTGYGAISLNSSEDDDLEDDDEWDDDNDDGLPGASSSSQEDERWWWERWVFSPRRATVRRIVRCWWMRNGVLVLLPAVFTILWCAIPFPTYPLPEGEQPPPPPPPPPPTTTTTTAAAATTPTPSPPEQLTWHLARTILTSQLTSLTTTTAPTHTLPKTPGHGAATVRLNFWFFLFVYYLPYNLLGLLWITKLFNLYSLNWWPSRLGFRITYTLFALASLALALPFYLCPQLLPYADHNLTWILLTFTTMTAPLAVAFLVLVKEHRSRYATVARRYVPSATQALFTPTISGASTHHRTHSHPPTTSAKKHQKSEIHHVTPPRRVRIPTLPASYTRFLLFLALLTTSLLAYLLGELYAELYLRTLPHSTLTTLIYVYSWIATIQLLDLSTSYLSATLIRSRPLASAIKFFFLLTYQTYVRALYARLRSPRQFLVLQVVSSSGVVGWNTLAATSVAWRVVRFFSGGDDEGGLRGYRRDVARSVWLRGVAENMSMVAWLGWVVVLHYGGNRGVYPYFAFESGKGGWGWPGSGSAGSGMEVLTSASMATTWWEQVMGWLRDVDKRGGDEEVYTFELTFYASVATWACEVFAGQVVRWVLRRWMRTDVERVARRDLVRYPELVGAIVVGGAHVLQNMLVGMVRVRFS